MELFQKKSELRAGSFLVGIFAKQDQNICLSMLVAIEEWTNEFSDDSSPYWLL